MVERLNAVYYLVEVDTSATDIYTLSLHDALPIFDTIRELRADIEQRIREQLDEEIEGRFRAAAVDELVRGGAEASLDRKSTRLNSSHSQTSYAVFCLKKKNITLRLSSRIQFPEIR